MIVARFPSPRGEPGAARSRRPTASAQETTLDLLWISHRVVCFAGGSPGELLFRAILVLEGPAHTPRALAASDAGALNGYRSLPDRLDHPVQVVIRPEPFEAQRYADRWESRVARLPGALAALAREHTAWARADLAELGLLHRRAYMVVPADDGAAEVPVGRGGLTGRVRWGLGRAPERAPVAGADLARAVLEERCGRLAGALGTAGVVATRLDNLALAKLYRACWNPASGAAPRTDRDLAARFGGRS
jgi:hypothetical protein